MNLQKKQEKQEKNGNRKNAVYFADISDDMLKKYV